jgi:phosphoglycerate kinase
MRSLTDLSVQGKVVLTRLDLNVPIDPRGEVANDTKIRASLPTVRWISEHGGRGVCMSHLGRPKGGPDPKLSLAPVAARMSELLGKEVRLAPGLVGPEVEAAVKGLGDGGCLLLENIRFDPGEKACADDFTAQLAALGDLYVNDAFGTCHRAHASVAGLPGKLPSAAGFLLRKEVETLQRLMKSPETPFVAVLGGAKVADKIPVIENLLKLCDRILLGGAMAYTFLVARGEDVGDSLVEKERVDLSRALLEDGGDRLILPRDHVVKTGAGEVQTVERIPPGAKGMDIGPKTRAAFVEAMGGARTVVWNGPLGVFEEDDFAGGSRAVAEAMAGLEGGLSAIGGGDTISAIALLSDPEKFGYISTGGGAFLEFLSGKTLPGVDALERSA